MQKNSNLISPIIERTLRQIILKDLANKGRKNFDKNHTLAVVYWTKQLLKIINSKQNGKQNKTKIDKKLNSKILITAAYAHDWGYASLFQNSDSDDYAAIQAQKQLHMWQGAIKIERLLYQRLSSHFSEAEIIRVAHLVYIHDQLDKLKDEDEVLLMEADTLGALDTDRMKPTFSKKDHHRFIQEVRKKRLAGFVHSQASKLGKELIKKRIAFYE
ncbi:MAG: hypothetical protein PVJ09_00825 [Candidatus Woesebacteria bacterium]|jgi:hypothetical protein